MKQHSCVLLFLLFLLCEALGRPVSKFSPKDVISYLKEKVDGSGFRMSASGWEKSLEEEQVHGGLMNSITLDRDHEALKELGFGKALDRHRVLAIWCHLTCLKGCGCEKALDSLRSKGRSREEEEGGDLNERNAAERMEEVSGGSEERRREEQEDVNNENEREPEVNSLGDSIPEKVEVMDSVGGVEEKERQVTGEGTYTSGGQGSAEEESGKASPKKEKKSVKELGDTDQDGTKDARKAAAEIVQKKVRAKIQAKHNIKPKSDTATQTPTGKSEEIEKGKDGILLNQKKEQSQEEIDADERRYKGLIESDEAGRAIHLGNYGNFLFRQGRMEDAGTAYADAFKAGNREPNHLGNYALLVMKRGKQGEKEAESLFLKALNANPAHGINLGNYANLVLRQGRLDEADKLYKRALLSDLGGAGSEKLEEVITGYAATLKAQGKVTEAMEQYKRAIKTKPTSHAVHLNNYAELLGKEGRLDEAAKYYMQAMRIAPQQPFPYYNIACIKCMQLKSKECLAWLQRAVAMGYSDSAHAGKDKDLALVRERYWVEFKVLQGSMDRKQSHRKGVRPPSFIFWRDEL